MKKNIFNFALITMLTGLITVAGCSSSKDATGSDTTKMNDTSKMSAPATTTDTAKKDTMKKDTVHH